MINVVSLKINDLATSIDVEITTSVGETFTQVLIYDYLTEESDALDASEFLGQNANTESFSIPNTFLEVEKIAGLYFIKVVTSEVIIPDDDPANVNQKTLFVANLIKYNECLLNAVLALEIDGCKELISAPCEDCKSNTTDTHMLLASIDYSLRYGFTDESIRILKTLDDLCMVCNNCPDYPDVYIVNGAGYGIEDNVITLV